MIVPRDVLVRHGIVDSPRVCALPPTVQLFFRNILHVCDGAGRFLTDADELRRALYGRSPGVQCSHVDAWLQKIYLAGLVKLYTRGARGYGEVLNFGQRDTKRKVLYPADSEEELNFAPRFDAADDPPPPRAKKNRIEGKCVKKPPHTHDTISQEEWLASLQAQWPDVNFAVEMQAAQAYVRKQRGPAAKLTRRFFEEHWLAGVAGDVDINAVRKAQQSASPEIDAPQNWQELIAETSYGPGGAFEVQSWAQVPGDVRAHLMRENLTTNQRV